MQRLKTSYHSTIKTELLKELGVGNLLSVPRLLKVVLNIGVGQIRQDQRRLERIGEVLATISGQKAVVRSAKKSIASFKLRAGEPIGYSLTLRGQRMYDFIERFLRVVLPRVRDFRGIPLSSIDRQGNLTIGLAEMSVFPELDHEQMDIAPGIEITFVTQSRNREHGQKLLEKIGVPFAREQTKE